MLLVTGAMAMFSFNYISIIQPASGAFVPLLEYIDWIAALALPIILKANAKHV